MREYCRQATSLRHPQTQQRYQARSQRQPFPCRERGGREPNPNPTLAELHAKLCHMADKIDRLSATVGWTARQVSGGGSRQHQQQQQHERMPGPPTGKPTAEAQGGRAHSHAAYGGRAHAHAAHAGWAHVQVAHGVRPHGETLPGPPPGTPPAEARVHAANGGRYRPGQHDERLHAYRDTRQAQATHTQTMQGAQAMQAHAMSHTAHHAKAAVRQPGRSAPVQHQPPARAATQQPSMAATGQVPAPTTTGNDSSQQGRRAKHAHLPQQSSVTPAAQTMVPAARQPKVRHAHAHLTAMNAQRKADKAERVAAGTQPQRGTRQAKRKLTAGLQPATQTCVAVLSDTGAVACAEVATDAPPATQPFTTGPADVPPAKQPGFAALHLTPLTGVKSGTGPPPATPAGKVAAQPDAAQPARVPATLPAAASPHATPPEAAAVAGVWGLVSVASPPAAQPGTDPATSAPGPQRVAAAQTTPPSVRRTSFRDALSPPLPVPNFNPLTIAPPSATATESVHQPMVTPTKFMVLRSRTNPKMSTKPQDARTVTTSGGTACAVSSGM